MENKKLQNLLHKLAKFGVLPRSELKNYQSVLRPLLRKKWVQKTFKKGRVFYEFTNEALNFLENYRKQRLLQLMTLFEVYPRNKVYSSLARGDLRFLDEADPNAEEFRFLSDWQFKYPVAEGQLTLSKARYFDKLNALET